MDRFQYLMVMAACVAVTAPLEVLLGARVYRRPGRALRALAPTVVVFTGWDALAIARGHWDYADRYVTGWQLPGAVPVEEFVFFVVVPLCALLTFDTVQHLLGDDPRHDGPGRTDRRGSRA